jgi:hypothetical protein
MKHPDRCEYGISGFDGVFLPTHADDPCSLENIPAVLNLMGMLLPLISWSHLIHQEGEVLSSRGFFIDQDPEDPSPSSDGEFSMDRFSYIGVNNPLDLKGAEKGERDAIAAFDADPFGTEKPLCDKRAERNPFKRTPLTEAANPVKAYEIFAAGKPLVSVPLPEMRAFAPLARFASTARQFERKIEAELRQAASLL